MATEKQREAWQRYRETHREEIRARDRKRRSRNKEKARAYQRQYYADHREEKRLAQLRYRTKNREKLAAKRRQYVESGRARDSDLRRVYGIDLIQWNAKLAAQGGLCAVCRKWPPVDTDHDHATGHTRGLLCRPCNLLLGAAADDPSVLLSAAKYLLRHAAVKGDRQLELLDDLEGVIA